MCKRRFLDIDILEPTCQLSLRQERSGEQHRKILTIFDCGHIILQLSLVKSSSPGYQHSDISSQARCPSCCWTNSVKALKACIISPTNFTYYLAESLSWYSLDRLKHSWTPPSVHSRFIAANSSSENGSVSSIRVITSTTIFASD